MEPNIRDMLLQLIRGAPAKLWVLPSGHPLLCLGSAGAWAAQAECPVAWLPPSQASRAGCSSWGSLKGGAASFIMPWGLGKVALVP